MLSHPPPCGRLSRYIKFTSALETNNKVRAAAQNCRSVGSLLPHCCWVLSTLVPPPPPALQELHEQVMEMRNTIQQLRNELESRPTSVRYDSLMAEVRRSTTPATASNIPATPLPPLTKTRLAVCQTARGASQARARAHVRDPRPQGGEGGVDAGREPREHARAGTPPPHSKSSPSPPCPPRPPMPNAQ